MSQVMTKNLLDARLQGTPLYSAAANKVSEHTFTFSFDCRFTGVDFYAWGNNKGDNVTVLTEYYVPPLSTWKRYKKFGKSWNVSSQGNDRILLFPTEPKAGVRVKILYDNKGDAPVDFCLNLYTFVDQTKVDTSVGAEGEDW